MTHKRRVETTKSRALKRRLLKAATALVVLAPVGAFAQQAPPQAPVDPGPGDIIVTAQRREERLQNVPIQVTAIGAGTIEAAGIKNTADALQLVPNVSFDQSFTYLNSFITVRGISQINNADPPVAIVVDGVPQTNQKQLRMDLFDIERVEVLKGPQGGLYGRNALGGAVNIVTRAPSDRITDFAGITVGNGDAVEANLALSGPVAGKALLFRLSGGFKRDGGRIGNAWLDRNADFVRHDWNVKGQLNYEGIDRLKLDLRGSYRDFAAGATYDSVVASGDSDDIRPPRPDLEGLTTGHIADGSFKANLDLGRVGLTAITGYSDLIERYRGDLDFSNPLDNPGGFLGLGIQAGQGQNLSVRQISQELRLSSQGNGIFRWIVGAYYLHTGRELETRAFLDTDGSRAQFDDPAKRILSLRERNRNNAYAGYAQADLDLTDQLTLSGALRYDSDQRRQTDLATGTERRRSFDSVQPKVTLTYKLDPSRLVYATFGTGFRSGGFNAPTVAIPVFKAETLDNYEAGFKTSWFGRKLIVNGAVYLEQDRNYQFFFIDTATASQVIGNLDRVKIWGVELDVQAQPIRGLQLGGAIGTTDTNIRKSSLFPGVTGKHTPRTTPWTMNLMAQYSFALSGSMTATARADYQHNGRKYWQVDNADVQRSIDLVNLRAGIKTDRWGLYGFGRNILNVRYYADYNPRAFTGQPYDLGFRAQPATYGVEARLNF